MTTILHEGDIIRLSPLEVRILIALLAGKNTAYGLARQAETDYGDEVVRISNGSLLPALRRLEQLNFVYKLADGQYKNTPAGREVLRWQLERWARLIELAAERA